MAVVFPAPSGPTSPKSSPLPTVNESPSSAVTAPKRRTSASASSAGPDAVSRPADTRYLPVPVSVTWTGIPARSFPSRFFTVTSTG